jgi:glutamyl-tRNA synthetase
MAESARYCYEDFDEIDAQAAKKNLRPVVLEPLRAARDALAELDEWEISSIDEVIQRVARTFEINMGKIGQPIRVAVTGGAVSPPIDSTLWLIGKDRTIKRLDRALDLVKARAESS